MINCIFSIRVILISIKSIPRILHPRSTDYQSVPHCLMYLISVFGKSDYNKKYSQHIPSPQHRLLVCASHLNAFDISITVNLIKIKSIPGYFIPQHRLSVCALTSINYSHFNPMQQTHYVLKHHHHNKLFDSTTVRNIQP